MALRTKIKCIGTVFATSQMAGFNVNTIRFSDKGSLTKSLETREVQEPYEKKLGLYMGSKPSDGEAVEMGEVD